MTNVSLCYTPVGAPNAGKSSLLNALLGGRKVAGVSRKANTTDRDVRGVWVAEVEEPAKTAEQPETSASARAERLKARRRALSASADLKPSLPKNVQIVFIDAPGIIPHNQSGNCRELAASAWNGAHEADVILYVVDVVKRPTSQTFGVCKRLCPLPLRGGTLDPRERKFSGEVRDAEAEVRLAAGRNEPFRENNSEDEQLAQEDSTIDTVTEEEAFIEAGRSSSALAHRARRKWDDVDQTEPKPFHEVVGNSTNNKNTSWTALQNKNDEELPLPDGWSDQYAPKPTLLILNKIDKQPEFRWLTQRKQEFRQHADFRKVLFTSATENRGIGSVLQHLCDLALSDSRYSRPWLFPPQVKSSLSKIEQVREQIRAVLFTWFNSDVPYKIDQETVGWLDMSDSEVRIDHELTVPDSVVAR